MTEPFVGEIRLFAGNFAPSGYAACDGQLLPISQNTAVFSLLGTMYGGDGKSNFALPDLRGRIPIGMGRSTSSGTTYDQGEQGGSETVVLLNGEMPAHTHPWPVLSTASTAGQEKGGVATATIAAGYSAFNTAAPDAALAPTTTTPSPAFQNGAGHQNMAPFLVVTFIIAVQGVFPPRS